MTEQNVNIWISRLLIAVLVIIAVYLYFNPRVVYLERDEEVKRLEQELEKKEFIHNKEVQFWKDSIAKLRRADSIAFKNFEHETDSILSRISEIEALPYITDSIFYSWACARYGSMYPQLCSEADDDRHRKQRNSRNRSRTLQRGTNEEGQN